MQGRRNGAGRITQARSTDAEADAVAHAVPAQTYAGVIADGGSIDAVIAGAQTGAGRGIHATRSRHGKIGKHSIENESQTLGNVIRRTASQSRVVTF